MRDDFGRVILGGSLLIAAVVAWGLTSEPPVRDDAEQVAPPTVQLEEAAVDPFHSTPTPAPSEPIWRDSLALCGVRAVQVGAEIPMREPYEELFGACTKAVAPHGPWRAMVGVGR